MISIKKCSFLIFSLILLFLTSCIFSDYKETVELIPSDSQVIFNMNINSFFKRKAIYSKIEDMKEAPALEKFINNTGELAGAAIFSVMPEAGINFKEDLLPYLKANFTIAFYEMGSKMSLPFSHMSFEDFLKEDDIPPFIMVSNIDDKEGVEEFLLKLNSNNTYVKDTYKSREIFVSEKRCYYRDEDFLIVSSKPELMKKSLDCYDNIELSLIKDASFISFKEEKMNSDSIGFSYVNIPALKSDFLNYMPEASRIKWTELLDSLRYTGTSIELSLGKLNLNTFIVHNENLTPFAREFFSLSPGKIDSLSLFPRENSNVIAVSEPDRVLPLLFSLLEGSTISGIFNEKIVNLFGYSSSTLFTYLSDELTLGFKPENHMETGAYPEFGKIILNNSTLALKLKSGSPPALLLEGSQTFVSVFSTVTGTENYRGVYLFSIPGGTGSYCKVKDFYLLNAGKSNEYTKKIIDTSCGDNETVEEHIKDEISTEAIGVSYLNTNDLYLNYFNNYIRDEALKEKLKEFFSDYPEIMGNMNSIEDGYIITTVMPL